MPVKVSVPLHVRDEHVVDFDFYRPCEPGGDPFLAWTALQNGPPMQWTPHHGGHWIATRGADIKEILTDWERFSSSCAFIPQTDRPRAVPLEYDPPEHGPLRKMLIPAMTPSAVRIWVDEARSLAVQLIDDLLPQGRCEFIADFAQHLPIIIVLRILDLPVEDRLPLLDAVGSNLRPTSEEKRVASRAFMNEYIRDLVAKRRADPGDDLLSKALQSDIGGRVMTDGKAEGLASGLIGGGLDTVTATMGWMALFLAENPAHRQQLVSGEASHNNAIEELLRRFAVPNIARVVRNDMAYQGAQFKAGEQVLMSACLHSMDAEIFVDPLTVDFARRDAYKHSSFSHGNHRCIGAPLAMQELKIFLEEWLKRIPNFALDPNDPPVRATGIVHGVERLPLVW